MPCRHSLLKWQSSFIKWVYVVFYFISKGRIWGFSGTLPSEAEWPRVRLQDSWASESPSKYRHEAHCPSLRGFMGAGTSIPHPGVPQRLRGLWERPRSGPGVLGQRGWGFLVLLSCRRDGGSSCVGPARNHRTCHTEVKLPFQIPYQADI